MAMENYYYDQQFRRYIVQFMAIFEGLQCMTGQRDGNPGELINVPIQYGNKDRVVAHILGGNTQNKPIRLPVMSTNLSGLTLAPELRKGVGSQRRQTFMPLGGQFPDDISTVHYLAPIPYKATMDLSIYVSNTEQRFQILEQILMLFDPTIQIQTSDSAFDWTKITFVELEGINYEDNYPSGTERRMLVTTLTFTMPIYIAAPANLRDQYIKKIFMRIGVTNSTDATGNEIINDLDAQGIQYDKIFDLDDFDLDLSPPD